MSRWTRRPLPLAWLLIALAALAASCERTSSDEDDGNAPSVSGQGGSGGAGGSSSGGPVLGTDLVACGAQDLPGEACRDPSCWDAYCGVSFALTCEAGIWVGPNPRQDWDMVCPAGSESVSSLYEISMGACCGELRPRNDVHTEPPSCVHCPASAPQHGEPCSLPDDCAPRLIDCFYKCCCYGNLTWAQCDGESWRVITDCSSK